MCQLSFGFDDQIIERLVAHPRLRWQTILKMAGKGWITEQVSDRAAKMKRKKNAPC